MGSGCLAVLTEMTGRWTLHQRGKHQCFWFLRRRADTRFIGGLNRWLERTFLSLSSRGGGFWRNAELVSWKWSENFRRVSSTLTASEANFKISQLLVMFLNGPAGSVRNMLPGRHRPHVPDWRDEFLSMVRSLRMSHDHHKQSRSPGVSEGSVSSSALKPASVSLWLCGHSLITSGFLSAF